MDISTRSPLSLPRVVLVLQGGGALGAYQAGVYQALHEHGYTPDWVVGTSIGALNGALIAGNERSVRLAQLRAFWDAVAQEDLFDMRQVPDPARHLNSWWSTLDAIFNGVPGFFSPRRFYPFLFGYPVPAEAASFYDTSPLQNTLSRLVDLPYLNTPGGMRLTVSAIKVACGTLANFDTLHQTIGIQHVMASGALPPGFPPVRIDGELYWDGGLYSNTPLEIVLNDQPCVDTLCFMVDLWSGDGPEPLTFNQVQTRQKDVLYASRSKSHIDAYLRNYKLHRLVRSLQEKVAPELLSDDERRMLAEIQAETTMHVVRLEYAGRDWQMASKDVNFSRGSIAWRWEQGYKDALHALRLSPWRTTVPEGTGIVLHELEPGVTHCIGEDVVESSKG